MTLVVQKHQKKRHMQKFTTFLTVSKRSKL